VFYAFFKLLGKTGHLYFVLKGKQQHKESEGVHTPRWKTVASFASSQVTQDKTKLCKRGVHGNFL